MENEKVRYTYLLYIYTGPKGIENDIDAMLLSIIKDAKFNRGHAPTAVIVHTNYTGEPFINFEGDEIEIKTSPTVSYPSYFYLVGLNRGNNDNSEMATQESRG